MQRGWLSEISAQGDAPLNEAQAALVAAREAWRGDPRCASAIAALVEYGAGAAIDPLAEPDVGERLAAAFLDHMLPALGANPLGHFPLRHGGDGSLYTLLLAHEGRAFLSLSAREPGTYPAAAAGFGDGERHDIVLAGCGHGRIVRRRGDALEAEAVVLAPGTQIKLDSSYETLLAERVETRLVTLRLIRMEQYPGPVREYLLEDGAFLHQSAGDAQESRIELALALLGRMGRADALPVMQQLARGGNDHIRWQALRESIALDTAAGFALLQSIASDPADSLQGPARALRDRLHTSYPALAALEAA